ncbi:hypothetical protein THAOC_37564, partial [Thalassiosira oceanica]
MTRSQAGKLSHSNLIVSTMEPAVAVAEKGVPMVEVSAPSDLPGGYVFDAVANGQTISVTVPAGG